MRAIDEYDEDLLPELPRVGDGDDAPASDEELGLVPDADDGDERVGLDDATGLDEDAAGYTLDLPPDDALDDEGGVDAIPIEGLDEGDEYGWSDDGRGEDEPPFDGELELPALSPLTRDDGGEEGVDDLGGGDDVLSLRPLEGDDEDAEDSTFGDDVVLMRFDERPAGFPLLEPPTCEVTALGGGDLVALAEGVVGGRDGLFWSGDEGLTPVKGWPEGRAVSSVAVDPARGLGVVGTPEGAFRIDAQGAVVEVNGWAGGDPPEGFFVIGEPRGAGTPRRLWGRTNSGALFRSDDDGASWAGPLLFEPVVALAAPSSGGLVALCAGRDAPPRLARTEDGGQSWAASEGPPLEGAAHLAALRDWVAVASGAGPFLSHDRGQRWARVPGLPETGPVGLAAEPGGLALYAVHASGGRTVVARHRPGGGESAVVLDLASATVRALEVRAEGDTTWLRVASSAGYFRVGIRADLAP